MRIGESKQYQDIYEFEIAATRWMRRTRKIGKNPNSYNLLARRKNLILRSMLRVVGRGVLLIIHHKTKIVDHGSSSKIIIMEVYRPLSVAY